MQSSSLKVELSAENVKMYIDLHTQLKVPFEVTLSNYTTRIKSDLYDLHFMKNAQSNRVFVTYAKLKADVKNKPIPDIEISNLKYYQNNINKNLEFYADKIYNVDIKNAYATILFNDGIISADTFNYITTLPKTERLAAVGMLAGRKNVFQFDESGKVCSRMEIVSSTSNFFFYAVKRTYEIIDRCKMELQGAFIFSWVDGIYFSGEENGAMLQTLLADEYNLKSSFDELTEFEIKACEGYYLLSYFKDEEKKVFNIPMEDNSQRQAIYNYLLATNHNLGAQRGAGALHSHYLKTQNKQL